MCPFELEKKFDDGFKLGMIERRENIERLKRLKNSQEQEDQSKAFEQAEGRAGGTR